MKIFLFAVAVLCISVSFSSLSANLGDSVDQSCKLYGDPIPSSMHQPAARCDEMVFVHEGMWIEARFYDGSCCRLTYQKKTTPDGPDPKDKEWGADNGPFIAKEVDALLSANMQGHAWGSGDVNSLGASPFVQWKRDDGALAFEKGHILELVGPANADYESAVKQK
jgi:hypothetical protein